MKETSKKNISLNNTVNERRENIHSGQNIIQTLTYLSPAQHVKQISRRQDNSSIQGQNKTTTVLMVCNGCNILK